MNKIEIYFNNMMIKKIQEKIEKEKRKDLKRKGYTNEVIEEILQNRNHPINKIEN